MKILVTGAWADAKNHIDDLRCMGHEVFFMQQEAEGLPLSADEIEAVIGNGIFMHHEIRKFKNLKYIQLTSAGFDRVDMEYVNGEGIEIHNARGVYSVPIAETVLASLLSYFRGITTFAENQKNKVWEKCRGLGELSGKTVCIVGCGSVGSEIAKRLKAFDCKVIGLDIVVYDNENFDAMKSLESAKDFYGKSDIIITTVPLTDETRHMFNEEAFAQMKEGGVFVNVARGALVDEEALIAAVESGKIAHAILDVFEEEPLAEESRLWTLTSGNNNSADPCKATPSVTVMPHNSFVGDGNADRLWKVIYENISNFTKKQNNI